MARYSLAKIASFWGRTDSALNTTAKGQALEELTCYLFEKIPGIEVSRRNQLNFSGTEEIDVAFWNNQHQKGFYFLPSIILVECKNHSNPIDTRDVSYFINKVENRGQDFGILIASNGITGDHDQLTRAHHEIAVALSRRVRIIIISRDDIEKLIGSDNLVKLVKEKFCELAVSGSIFL